MRELNQSITFTNRQSLSFHSCPNYFMSEMKVFLVFLLPTIAVVVLKGSCCFKKGKATLSMQQPSNSHTIIMYVSKSTRVPTPNLCKCIPRIIAKRICYIMISIYNRMELSFNQTHSSIDFDSVCQNTIKITFLMC